MGYLLKICLHIDLGIVYEITALENQDNFIIKLVRLFLQIESYGECEAGPL